MLFCLLGFFGMLCNQLFYILGLYMTSPGVGEYLWPICRPFIQKARECPQSSSIQTPTPWRIAIRNTSITVMYSFARG
jgi:hypothetical protein